MADHYPSFIRGEISIEDIQTNNTDLAVGSQINVPAATLTTIVTIPANGLKFITQIICSAIESGRWEVHVDSTKKFVSRTINRTVYFNFSVPFRLEAASVLDVKLYHDGPGAGVDADAAVLGYAATP